MKSSNLKNILILILGVAFLTFVYVRDNQNHSLNPQIHESVNHYNVRCIDGDTFEMTVNNRREKIRLLAVDSPEDTKRKDLYGDVASAFTCDLLKNAEKIRVESDRGNEYDKYDRSLYWVFVDDKLLQEELVKEGLAEIKYVQKKTVNEIYLAKLKIAQKKAQVQKLYIWE